MRPDIAADHISVYSPRQYLRGKKICLIATVSYHLVNQLKNQAEYLRDLGMSVVLVSSGGPEVQHIRIGPHLRYAIIPIPRSLAPGKDLAALFRLTLFFHKNRFDIVHSTTPKAGFLSATSAFLAGVPIRLHTFTGQPWVTLKGVMRWGSRMADRLIGILNTKCYADSGSQAKFLVSEGIIPPRKIAVIGHGSLAGVDIDRFSSNQLSLSVKRQLKQSLSIDASSKIIIFVGRIAPDKGIAELISAFKELLKMDYNVDLLLLGPHDKDCGGINSLDLDSARQCPRLHYLGYAESPEKYLAISDIFCLPSYREGFGTVVIEAAAAGLPTVGTAIYGLTDAVVDGETGILVPPHDDRALGEALKRLLDHPDELHRMGRAARERCLLHFDARQINEKIAEEYVNLLKMKKIIH